MNTTNSIDTDQNPTRARRSKWINRALSAFIIASGLGWAASGSFDQARRQLLADRCLFSMSATQNMESERISEKVADCAEFLGWGELETFFLELERLPSSGWLIIAVSIGLAAGHKRLLRRRAGTTFGEWLDNKLEARRRQSFPPPAPSDIAD